MLEYASGDTVQRLLTPSSSPQPFKSKFRSGPTDHELQASRLQLRREKARLRMAQKRAELRARPHAEQVAAAERAREHQAAYRERHRKDLRDHEAKRRLKCVIPSFYFSN
ncbi:hypothetical protein DFH06DRAFT_1127331 [Mycena polygramma]|nr:hypothetical protein DFH06DRAFT_1127331 [Mycena polygramma]